MRRVHSKILLHAFVPVILAFSVLFAAIAPSQAQDGSAATPAATSPATSGDDSNELPIYINITGFVTEVTATSIRIGDQTLLIPAGMTLPDGIAVGKVASLRGNLRDDDTIIIVIIVPGYHLPTPTPMPTATQAPTEAATPPATEVATLPATQEPTPQGTPQPTGTAVAGCNKPGQKLALVLSAAYAKPYQQIVDMHCKGYSYGELARAYLILITGNDAGKSFTLIQILDLRRHGNHWRVIIIILDVQPDSTLIIFVIDGGRSTFFVDCGIKGNPKKSSYCGRSSQGNGNGNSQGNDDGNGKGKGKDKDKDKHDDDD